VQSFVELQHLKRAEKFIAFIHKDEHKIDPFIHCGKLRTAYLLAVRTGQRDKVLKIRDESKSRNMMTEYGLCEKYLNLSNSGNMAHFFLTSKQTHQGKSYEILELDKQPNLVVLYSSSVNRGSSRGAIRSVYGEQRADRKQNVGHSAAL
jgi:hypothetical protein